MVRITPPQGESEETQETITREDPLGQGSFRLTGTRIQVPVGLEAYTDPGATLVNDPQPDLLVTSHLFLGGETRFRTITRSQ
eukprot:scaffold226577_cov18-Tisochrysis_lutea.AAC.1